MINLASNYNVLGPPTNFYQYIQSLPPEEVYEVYAGDEYGSIDASDFASFFGVKGDNTLITTGSTEAIDLVTRITEKPTAYVPEPSFWEYRFFADRYGKDVVSMPISLFDTEWDFSGMLLKNPGVIYLCNPNNPTGHLFRKDYLVSLIRKYPEHLFLIDETYLMFHPEYSQISVSNLVTSYTNLFVISSLSKIFALPGLRLGIAVSASGNINKLSELKTPYSTLPLQVASIKYLLRCQEGYLHDSRIAAYRNTLELSEYLDKKGYGYLRSSANYMFVDGGHSGLYEYLKKKGILVRGGFEFGPEFDRYVRIRACDMASDDGVVLVKSLNEFKNSTRIRS